MRFYKKKYIQFSYGTYTPAEININKKTWKISFILYALRKNNMETEFGGQIIHLPSFVYLHRFRLLK